MNLLFRISSFSHCRNFSFSYFHIPTLHFEKTDRTLAHFGGLGKTATPANNCHLLALVGLRILGLAVDLVEGLRALNRRNRELEALARRLRSGRIKRCLQMRLHMKTQS